MSGGAVYRFGAFRLVPSRRELTLRGVTLEVGSRALDLLVLLVERHGELVTKDELMAAAWSASVVDENNLPAQISVLRKLLAGDPALADSVRTVSGRGYRFAARVESGTDESDERSRDDVPSIVVLPFANLSSDAEQAFFAQGMTETVTSDLSRIAGLVVLSPSAATAFGEHEADLAALSRTAGVRFALKGSVQRGAGNVRINARLLDAVTGAQLWSEIFDGDSRDLFSLQDQITGRIATSLGREIFAAVARERQALHVDLTARDLVMQGIAADCKPHTLERLQEQERLFGKAATLDPHDDNALARLARAILLQSLQGHAPPGFKAEALASGSHAAERAVALNPGNARAHLAMSYLHMLRGDFHLCRFASERAIALDRNLAMAHNMLATSFAHLGEGAAAVRAATIALRLDPIGPQFDVFSTTMGLARLLLGEVDAAIECFTRAREANPSLVRAHAGAAISLATKGALPAARLAAKELLRRFPSYRLSNTTDAALPTSPPGYRRFYDEVLLPGARSAGVPI